MKKIVTIFIMCFCLTLIAKNEKENLESLFKKRVSLGCSIQDAEIFVNGKLLGKGSLDITISSGSCVTVVVKSTGYFTEKIEFCNKKGWTKPPKTHYFEMIKDDSYEASVQTDIANIDIELKSSMGKTKTWKLINQIVLNYIDVIEMTDKETGYLRTSWSLKSFKYNTIRTRIIVKEYSDEPLIFKVKLVSEYSGSARTSVKSDEYFKEWDRVLRKYSNIISELQARIK
jgi:hypothetical protein